MTDLIVAIHSWRGGTGKSNITANVASILAARGLRVCVADADIKSPGIHTIFGIGDAEPESTLTDVVFGTATVASVTMQIQENLWLAPASMDVGKIARLHQRGYDPKVLNLALQDLLEELKLDVLLIDTHPGPGTESLLSLAICDLGLVIVRPDRQDLNGTAIMMTLAEKLEVPELAVIMNRVPDDFNFAQIRQQVESLYNLQIIAMLPHDNDLLKLASEELFCGKFPKHRITKEFERIASHIEETLHA